MAQQDHPLRKKNIAACVCTVIGNLMLFLTVWLHFTYDDVRLDQILYQIQTSAAGTQRDLTRSMILCILCSLIFSSIEILIFLYYSARLPVKYYKTSQNYAKVQENKWCARIRKYDFAFGLSAICLALCLFLAKMNIFSFAGAFFTESDFIRRNYANPNNTKLSFPEEKRNLIYIFLESMENTYADTSAGEPIAADYIPELTQLANDNISFSNSLNTGGAYVYSGSTWTAAAMVTQTSGMIIKVPLTSEAYNGENEYMPGIVSIGELLERKGYTQTLLLGSDAAFASRDSYFTEHGNYHIVDINSLKEEGRLPEDYREWWGYEDQKLFAFAKEEILKLADSGKPFNFTMLTADTHFPDGYLCPLCGDTYEEQYPNVLACASKQIAEFIAWIQEQDFYENTTIVLSGDHLTMDPSFLNGIEENYTRTTYNCFINSAVEPILEKNREFGTFDMFPTTLAAMGIEIDGNRLGLGTNLFSAQVTLTEQYGYDLLNEELQKHSQYYDRNFLYIYE